MAETTPVTRLPILPSERQTYERARLAGFRAALNEAPASDPVQKAISRLDAFLSAGRPPREDVPPGFYFNVKI